VVGVLVVIAGVVGVSTLLIRSNYFVVEQDSQVVVKRGIPGDIFGVSLASVSRIACLTDEGDLTLHDPDSIPVGCNVFTLGDLREPARESVRAGMPSGSLPEATGQVVRLAADNLLPPCETSAATPAEGTDEKATPSSSSPSPTPTTGQPGPAEGDTRTTPTDPAPREGSNPATREGSDPATEEDRATPSSPARPAPPQVPGENCRAVS